jgi:hypothetical protein
MTKEEILTGTNTTIEKIKSQLASAFKKIGAISIIIMAIGSGFVIGYYYNTIFCKITEIPKHKHVNTLSETSIAINEKDQVLLINKIDGSYVVYEDSIGTILCNMYINKRFINQTTTISK